MLLENGKTYILLTSQQVLMRFYYSLIIPLVQYIVVQSVAYLLRMELKVMQVISQVKYLLISMVMILDTMSMGLGYEFSRALVATIQNYKSIVLRA